MDIQQVGVAIRVKVSPSGQVDTSTQQAVDELMRCWEPSEEFAFGDRAEIAGGKVEIEVTGLRVVPATSVYALSERSFYLAAMTRHGWRRRPKCMVIGRATITCIRRRFTRTPDGSEFGRLSLVGADGEEMAAIVAKHVPGFGLHSTVVEQLREITTELGHQTALKGPRCSFYPSLRLRTPGDNLVYAQFAECSVELS